MTQPHWHAEIEFNYLFDGEFEYILNGKRLVVPPHRPVIFWAAISHQLVKSNANTRMCWMHFPLAETFRWNLANHLTKRLLHGEVIVAPDHLVTDEMVIRWHNDLSSMDPHRIPIVGLEVEAFLRRVALFVIDSDARNIVPTADPDLIEQTFTIIAGHYTEDITVEWIAQRIGVHSKHLMSAFRSSTGWTVRQEIERQRLAAAQRLLMTTDLAIDEVATRSGFGSVSRFHAVFSARLQTTPKRFRTTIGGR